MRTIRLPAKVLQEYEWKGRYSVCTVKVDWPELQLTDDQIVANAHAMLYGQERPHPDLSLISIEIEHPTVRDV
ncbi:hypothetical protein LCGC14_0712850 [marine sediment metagenome]|uniref:Uncharacterized protein n=1 Tax=marine sediment metagenome TaxID=412755 RepID=A0A0F9QEJ7_9ZZZZ